MRGLSCPGARPGTAPTLATPVSAEVLMEEADKAVLERWTSEEANNDTAVVGAAVAAADRGIKPLLLTKRPGGFLVLVVMVLVEARLLIIRTEVGL